MRNGIDHWQEIFLITALPKVFQILWKKTLKIVKCTRKRETKGRRPVLLTGVKNQSESWKWIFQRMSICSLFVFAIFI